MLSGRDVVVQYHTEDDTAGAHQATAGVDYTPVPAADPDAMPAVAATSVTIPAGQEDFWFVNVTDEQ